MTTATEVETIQASHVLAVNIPKQDIADLCDVAGGGGINYWAARSRLDERAGTYRVWVDAPEEIAPLEANRTIQFEWIARMIVRLAAGDPSLDALVGGQTALACRRYVGSILMGEPDMDFDAFDADTIIQLCYFRGKLVFG